MTWKEFKDEVERQGVKDEDLIKYIDINDTDPINISTRKNVKEIW